MTLNVFAPSPPDQKHWLGTDDTSRDVLARIIYGFRLSVFCNCCYFISSIIGTFGGYSRFFVVDDLIFQRLIEVLGGNPSLYIIIIVAAILQMNFGFLSFFVFVFMDSLSRSS